MEIWGNLGLWSLFLDYKGITLLGLSGKVYATFLSFLLHACFAWGHGSHFACILWAWEKCMIVRLTTPI